MSKHPSVTGDPAKWKADRLSQIIPAHVLAYSCILKSPNHRISLADLLNEMLSFPDVPDARNIYLLPEEIDGFDCDEDDTPFRVSISHYIRFDMSDLMKVLTPDHFCIENEQVTLAKPVRRDLSKTLVALRHLFPDDDEYEFRRKASAGLISYFHKLKLKPEEVRYPELLNPEDFLYFEERPAPYQALVCLFLSQRTNVIPLSEYVDLRYSVQVFIGSQKVSIGSVIGDVASVILRSHFFAMDDDAITMYPPIFYDVLFTSDTNAYRYKPGESMSIIPSPIGKIRRNPIAPEAATKPKAERRSYERYFQAFKRTLSEDSTFTADDIFSYVSATFCPSQFLQGMQRSDAERLRHEITVWIEKNAEEVVQADVIEESTQLVKLRLEKMNRLLIDPHDEERKEFLGRVIDGITKSYKELLECNEIEDLTEGKASTGFKQRLYHIKK